MAIVLPGTLDTKGQEILYARDLLRGHGLEAWIIDAGTRSSGDLEAEARISSERVFHAAGTSLDAVRAKGDRGEAIAAAARGTSAIVRELIAQGQVEGILGLGGSAGTTIGTAAMREAPFGMPKVMVSTLASGQTRPYVGGSDIAMFASVADIAGLNRITKTVIANAAAAIAGMVQARRSASAPARPLGDERPVVVATMFGVTTPCVERARAILERAGIEVLVFHATGVGGQAMEGLIRDGAAQGVLDLTTTELADEVGGGVLSAGPDRLKAAARAGVPQVVSLGALDMVNFGPMETVPESFRSRRLYVHNPTVTLMRTTAEENVRIARMIADALKSARGPVALLIPEGGVSALDAPGKAFHDPEADAALIRTLEAELRDSPQVHLIKRPEHINDPSFADAAVRTLLDLMRRAESVKDQE